MEAWCLGACVEKIGRGWLRGADEVFMQGVCEDEATKHSRKAGVGLMNKGTAGWDQACSLELLPAAILWQQRRLCACLVCANTQ